MPLRCPDNSEMLSACCRNQCPDVPEICNLKLWGIQNHDPPNHFKIPQQFEHFILANSLLIGNNEKSNENMGKNKDSNYEEHNSNNVFPDYETCDEMPKYEDWF
ncbi:hypothetical protein [Acetivibrio clariflavus]|uniref:hypothetical protein n=1 Tax=Acetivibrio clariflavus TaxID=288965 RepID=UPI0004825B8C|nr:hypothetical protein [Acetivibrio clariflavus]